MKEKIAKNWTIIVFPTSAPFDWVSFLDNLDCEFVLSPLHNIERPHYHILLKFSFAKRFDEVSIISKMINGTSPQICHDVNLLLRYFSGDKND